MKIEVDPDRDGLIKCTLHELIHVEFPNIVPNPVDNEIEETIVIALEAVLNEYIEKSPSRLKSWRIAIDKKLNATTEEEDE